MNLSFLIRHDNPNVNLDVPKGFCITTDAYSGECRFLWFYVVEDLTFSFVQHFLNSRYVLSVCSKQRFDFKLHRSFVGRHCSRKPNNDRELSKHRKGDS